MKLCRYGDIGHEKPGIIDADGKLRDLSAVIDDIDASRLEPHKLQALSALNVDTLPLVRQRIHDPAAGRHHRNRHAPRRRHG